jgi:hypothetical protein
VIRAWSAAEIVPNRFLAIDSGKRPNRTLTVIIRPVRPGNYLEPVRSEQERIVIVERDHMVVGGKRAGRIGRPDLMPHVVYYHMDQTDLPGRKLDLDPVHDSVS